MHISVFKFLMGVIVGMILIISFPEIHDSFDAIGAARVNIIFEPMEKIK